MTGIPAARSVTIEDVARVAGVSRAAVSKVLRDAYGVSPSMKHRVNAAIEQLDYRPRLAARAMRGYRTFTLGIEIPDFGNAFFGRVLAGARQALHGTNYQLLIAPADAGPREGHRALAALLDRQVDALVAVSPMVDQQELERIAATTPVVMFGRHDSSGAYDTVAGDDAAGAQELMTHLIAQGHTRIAHLSRDELATTAEDGTPHGIRLQAYAEEMTKAGRQEFIDIVRTAEGELEARAATLAMLSASNPPTAIFAGHDALALGALRAVMELGLDVSVAGYDDVPVASHPGIDLTTVSQPGEEMGARAITMLLERLAGREEAVHEVFEPTLVTRGSTRPPPPEPTPSARLDTPLR